MLDKIEGHDGLFTAKMLKQRPALGMRKFRQKQEFLLFLVKIYAFSYLVRVFQVVLQDLLPVYSKSFLFLISQASCHQVAERQGKTHSTYRMTGKSFHQQRKTKEAHLNSMNNTIKEYINNSGSLISKFES